MDHIRSTGVPSFRGMLVSYISPLCVSRPGGGVMCGVMLAVAAVGVCDVIAVFPGPVSVTARVAPCVTVVRPN